jgi:hypothetical protein
MMNRRVMNVYGSLAVAVFLLVTLIACGNTGGEGGGSPAIPSLSEVTITALQGNEYDTGCNDAASLPVNKAEALESFGDALALLPNITGSSGGPAYSMGARTAMEENIDYNFSSLTPEEKAEWEAAGIYDMSGYMKGKIYMSDNDVADWGPDDYYMLMDLNFDMKYRFDSTRNGVYPSLPWIKGRLSAKGSEYITLHSGGGNFRFNVAYAYAIAYKPVYGKGGKFILNLGLVAEGNDDSPIGDPLYKGTLLVYKDDGTLFGSYDLDADELEEFASLF